MSDIGIRLDGLLLGMAMAAGGLLFGVIAAISTFWTWLAEPGPLRSWKIAARSAGMALLHAAGFAVLALCLDEFGAPIEGPDLIDWLALPWVVLILVGLVVLVRSRARPAD